MAPQQFFQSQNTRTFANVVYEKTHIPQSVIMAQMGIETAYGQSQPWRVCKNPAGIKQYSPTPCQANDGGWYRSYSTYAAAAQEYADFYLNNSYYSHVLAVAQSGGSPEQVATALGQSPWASSHYRLTPSSPDGSLLISIMRQYNLTQYDVTPSKGHAPPPPTMPSSSPHPSAKPSYLLLATSIGLLTAGGMLLYRRETGRRK